MEKQQTALEWLYEKVWKEMDFSISSSILEEAKEIEKKQIVETHKSASRIRHPLGSKLAYEYYNKRFSDINSDSDN